MVAYFLLIITLLGVSHGLNFDLANYFRTLGLDPSLAITQSFPELQLTPEQQQYLYSCYNPNYGQQPVNIYELSMEQTLENFLAVEKERDDPVNTVNTADAVDTEQKIRQFIGNVRKLAGDIKSCLSSHVANPRILRNILGMQNYFLTVCLVFIFMF